MLLTGNTIPRIAVVGAGAAGCMAALHAAGGAAEVLLLESGARGGRKILTSGGGRCNILPARVDTSRFVTDSSPNTLRNIVLSWPLPEQIAFFEGEAGIPLREETDSGKLFPASDRARDVRDALLRLARERGARLLVRCRVTDLANGGDGWTLRCASGDALAADAVVLATGGLSVPATGSDGLGLRIAEELGLSAVRPYPALVPLRAAGADFRDLAGISLAATVTARGGGRSAMARGGFLFTHHGYSGPAVLDVSHIVARCELDGAPAARVTVCWTGRSAQEWTALLAQPRAATVAGLLRRELPERLVRALLQRVGVPEAQPVAQLRREERLALLAQLTECPLPCAGTDGFRSAEVTGGGICLRELHAKTLECKRLPRLYLCGEMLDAFGPIGGYNFLWAWSTGRIAGQSARMKTV